MTNEPPVEPEADAIPTPVNSQITDADSSEAPDDNAPPPRTRLARSQSNRMIAGVAGGLGEYFDVDPTIVRVAIVIVTIITGGAFALIYIAAILIMPRSDTAGAPIRGAGGLGGGGSNAAAVVIGLILIAIGVAALAQAADLPEFRWDALLALMLALVGLAIVFESRRGPNGGLIAVGIVLTAVLAVATAVPSARWDSGFGDRTVHPTSLANLERSYDHAFGSMVVDLRDVPFPEGETRIRIGVAFGDLSVRLPDELAVRVTGRTIFGSSAVLGQQYDGITVDVDAETGGYADAPRRVEIELSTAFGSATVQ